MSFLLCAQPQEQLTAQQTFHQAGPEQPNEAELPEVHTAATVNSCDTYDPHRVSDSKKNTNDT